MLSLLSLCRVPFTHVSPCTNSTASLLIRAELHAPLPCRLGQPQQQVAIKEIPLPEGHCSAADGCPAGSIAAGGIATGSSSSSRVLKEASILSSLHHPNIVTYHESFVEGGLCRGYVQQYRKLHALRLLLVALQEGSDHASTNYGCCPGAVLRAMQQASCHVMAGGMNIPTPMAAALLLAPAGGCLYLVMELVQGPSLAAHLAALTDRGRAMAEQDIWQVGGMGFEGTRACWRWCWCMQAAAFWISIV